MKLVKLFSKKGPLMFLGERFMIKSLQIGVSSYIPCFFESYVYIHMHNFATCIIHIYSLFLN